MIVIFIIKQFVNNFYRCMNSSTYLFGKLHSINDLPAYVYDNGIKHWYYNGKIHRENDLHASVYANGTKCWYYDGKEHRENDLPAFIGFNGDKNWYYNGLRLEKMIYLHLFLLI